MAAEIDQSRSQGWINRVTDWFNPILVKETRQSLKSRGFVMTFMLMLIACWIVSFYYTMIEGSHLEYGTGGRDVFYWYYGVLCFAVLVAVPFGAYRSLLAEREETTFDLLSITTLKPRQIVWGKLSSSLLQTMIYYAAIAPFIAFTSLLQGMDLLLGMFFLGSVMLASVLLSMVCLTSGALTKQRVWQIFTTLAMLLGLFLAAMFFATGLPDLFNFSFQPADLRTATFWYVMGTIVVWAASYFFLLQQIATALLTFDADNRSTGVRVVCSLQFLLLWAGLIVIGWQVRGTPGPPGVGSTSTSVIPPEIFFSAVSISLIHWALVGLFAVTEWDDLSPRLTNRLPRSPLVRFLWLPWLPGGARGLVYIVGHAVLLFLVSWFCVHQFGVVADFPWQFVGGACAYLLIFVGFTSFMGRMLMGLSHELRPAHSRVLAVITLALFMIVPHLIDLATRERGGYGYSLLFITVPHETLSYLAMEETPQMTRVSIILWTLAIVAVSLNLLAIARGVREILSPDRDNGTSA